METGLYIVGFLFIVYFTSRGIIAEIRKFRDSKKPIKEENEDINFFASQDDIQRIFTEKMDQYVSKVKTEVQGLQNTTEKIVGTELNANKELLEGQQKRVLEKFTDDIENHKKSIGLQFESVKENLKSGMDLDKKNLENTQGLMNLFLDTTKRGKLGETNFENMIQSHELVKGFDYDKHMKIGDHIPDYSFKSQVGIINVDVKFPMENYSKYITSDESKRDYYKKEFMGNIKKHINDISEKDYINVELGCYDKVFLFIPNLNCFNFVISEKIIDGNNKVNAFDYAVKKNVILCSLTTFYPALHMIREFNLNTKRLEVWKKTMAHTSVIHIEWNKFIGDKEGMGKAAKMISDLNDLFHKIMSTRRNKLDRGMQNIIDSNFETSTNDTVGNLINFEKSPKPTPVNKN